MNSSLLICVVASIFMACSSGNANAQTPARKNAADAEGYCTEEYYDAAQKMVVQSEDFAQRALDLVTKLVSEKISEQDQIKYKNELLEEGRKIIALCDETEATWGEFTCKTRNEDGSDGPVVDSKAIKDICDQLRAKMQE